MIYNLIITPIETIIDWVFNFLTVKCSSLGIIGAILGVSLVINFLALPIYNVADSLQEKERKIAKSLESRSKRIKKAFKGDEQFMMLSTYYRQNNYHPLYVLRSSISILIEIPFFIAAYHYLSNCESLMGASWWIFNDLGLPDRMFSIPLGKSVFYINLLPILMTLINFVSGAIYSKEAPLREKVQLYVVALIFLVMLYNSPSGLVLYWILNNLFSLIKNIVMKLKHPGRILYATIVLLMVGLAVFFMSTSSTKNEKSLVVCAAFIVCVLPILVKLVLFVLKKYFRFDLDEPICKNNFSLMFFSCSALAVLCGFVLPSSAIASSPVEFSFLGENPNPMTYVWNTFFVFLGVFVFWPTVIYKLFGNKVKNVISWGFFAVFMGALANIYIFKHDYGELNFAMDLNVGNLKKSPVAYVIVPLIIFAAMVAVYFVLKKYNKVKWLSIFLCSVCIAEIGLGFVKSSTINKIYKQYAANLIENNLSKDNEASISPVFHLSKSEKNVIVLFLDRGINSFFPIIMEKFPEIKAQFDGFTYYPNTVSFSINTDLGTQAMMGGYEYVPEKINERSDELLKDKHNEATLVLPRIFSEGGWNVTVTDPPCPNYSWKADLSAFKNYPEIFVDELIGRYNATYRSEKNIAGANKDKTCKEGMMKYSITQMLYPPIRYIFYKGLKVSGVESSEFFDSFSELYYMKELTDFDSEKNTYFFIDNETPHHPTYLDSEFECPVDDNSFLKQFYVGNSEDDEKHFSVNVASYKQVGKWLDYLRENNCYDNTRIIIVSDHGYNINFKSLSDLGVDSELRRYNTILLYKDFYSNDEIKTDDVFMTNADTGFLAREGLGLSETNPFTNQFLKQEKAGGVNVYPLVSNEWNPTKMVEKKQFTLDKNTGYHVSGNVYDNSNWIRISEWERETSNGGNQ